MANTKLYVVRDMGFICKSFLTDDEVGMIKNMPTCSVMECRDIPVIGDIIPKDNESLYVVYKNHTFYFINVCAGCEDALLCLFDDYAQVGRMPVVQFEVSKDDLQIVG